MCKEGSRRREGVEEESLEAARDGSGIESEQCRGCSQVDGQQWKWKGCGTSTERYEVQKWVRDRWKFLGPTSGDWPYMSGGRMKARDAWKLRLWGRTDWRLTEPGKENYSTHPKETGLNGPCSGAEGAFILMPLDLVFRYPERHPGTHHLQYLKRNRIIEMRYLIEKF